MKVSIVIPQYRGMKLLHQVLWDLYKFCAGSIDEVLVVDDCGNDPDVGVYYIEGMMMRNGFLPIRVIRNEENLGFLKTCNRGAREASGDIIILLSNDVRVRSNFVEQIKEKIRENPHVLIGNRLIDWDSGWNTFDGRIFKYLEGWLLACTAEVWESLCGFDERYGSSDFEDVHLSTLALSKGYELISLNNELIQHVGAQSYGYNPERESRTKKNKELFRKIWVDNETSR